MIYGLHNTIESGRRKKVFDALWRCMGKVIECDTETGRVLRYKQDRRGVIQLNANRCAAATEIIYGKAPLRLLDVGRCLTEKEIQKTLEKMEETT